VSGATTAALYSPLHIVCLANSDTIQAPFRGRGPILLQPQKHGPRLTQHTQMPVLLLNLQALERKQRCKTPQFRHVSRPSPYAALQRDSGRRFHPSPPAIRAPNPVLCRYNAGVAPRGPFCLPSSFFHIEPSEIRIIMHPIWWGDPFVLISSPFPASLCADCSTPQADGARRTDGRVLRAPVCTEDSKGDAGSRPRMQHADCNRTVALASCRGGAVAGQKVP
jgi:hypothetical protein